MIKQILMAICLSLVSMFSLAEDVVVSGTRMDMIKGKQVIYLKDDVDNLLSRIKGTVTPKRYPMFIYNLNDVVPNLSYDKDSSGKVIEIEYPNASDPYSHTEWTDFELKATTNNFYSTKGTIANLKLVNDNDVVVSNIAKNVKSINPMGDIVFFSVSSARILESERGDDSDIGDPMESMRKYVHDVKVNGINVDSKGLTFYSSIGELSIIPPQVTFILDPTRFTHTKDNSWCNDQNPEIIWSIARCDSTGDFEKDDDGNVIWRNIVPIGWFVELPNWAYTNGEVRVVNEKWYNLYNK